MNNVSVSSYNSRRFINFTGKKTSQPINSADQFLSDVDKNVKSMENGNFFSRYLWSPTAIYASFIPFAGYGFYNLAKLWSLKKAERMLEHDTVLSKFHKRFPVGLVASLVAVAGLQYIFSLNSDKKLEKFQQDFKEINTKTDARLRDQVIRSSMIGAMCSPMCGEVTFNKNLVMDPISRRKLKKLIKHELVHAGQYETIARSENGIKKLNYAVLKSTSKLMSNPKASAEIEAIYQDIINDKTGKYENITVRMVGTDVDFKKYIIAIHTLNTNKDAGFDDIPMVIDELHYEKVREEKGALTQEQEQKAQQYYQAQIDYPPLTFWNMINPFSPYYNNLLEREAYKESPNLITRFRHLFVKD